MVERENAIIFGTSTGAEEVLTLLNKEKVNIVGYLDSNESKTGLVYKGKEIFHPSHILKLNFNYIIIGSVSFEDEMVNQLLYEGVLPSMILTPLSKIGGRKKKYYSQTYKEYLLYKEIFSSTGLNRMFNDYGFCAMNHKSTEQRLIPIYESPDYLLSGIDYVRVSTVELLAREIISNNIEGAIAELGVYKGNFTKILSNLFPTRELFLFDTFEGFSENDIGIEKENKFSRAKKGHLGDTNIQKVLEKVRENQEVIIRKGYFPETTKGLMNDVYAFVSIDVDLYKPTYEGLKYFYDRLTKGGYIIIHDYNFDTYRGVKEAVQQFCNEKQISYVPISDYFGSVVITK